MSNLKIMAAVAGVLAVGAASTGVAAVVTQPQAASAPFQFYMGGSSAAVSGFGSAVGADMCQAGTLATFVTNPSKQPSSGTITAPKTPDFRAFSCVAAKPAAFAGQIVTIYYRAEAGSVVGVYAPLNNVAVNQLNLNTALCIADPSTSGQYDCATSNNPGGVTGQNSTNSVVGDSPDNGPADSYSGAVTPHILEYGISDVEPGALGNSLGEAWAGNGNNDPVTGAYYTFLGADHTPDQLQAMSHTLLFQQSFGFVANSGITNTISGVAYPISNITTAAVASILAGTVTNWNQLINPVTGVPYSGTTSVPIVVCHRDLGSGTRTSADIIFEKDGCDPTGATVPLNDFGTVADSYSTGDVLSCVNGAAGGFGYVSIDNNSKAGASPYGSVVALTLDGRTASNALTAEGGWDYAVEASANKNTNFTFNANQTAFYGYLIPALQALATAPQSAQVNALPGVAGNSKNNGTLQTNGKIHVTSVYRSTGGGNSCNPLLQQ